MGRRKPFSDGWGIGGGGGWDCGPGWTRGGMRIALILVVCCLCEVGGWIALSKDGFKATKRLLLNNNSRIEGDILINGVVQWGNYTWLGPTVEDTERCDASRRGAMRWNVQLEDFEGCDGLGEWAALQFCDRDCGFSPAPTPSIRPYGEGGAVNCSQEVDRGNASSLPCVVGCEATFVNTAAAPTLTRDACALILERRYASFGVCENITADDAQFRSYVLGTGSFFDPNSTEVADGPNPADVVLCGAQLSESCEVLEGVRYCVRAELDFYAWKAQPAIDQSRIWRLGRPDAPSTFVACGTLVIPVQNRYLRVVSDVDANMIRIHAHTAPRLDSPSEIVWIRNPAGVATFETACALAVLGAADPVNSAFADERQNVQNGPLPEPLPSTTCDLYNFSSPAFDYLHAFYNVSGWDALLPAPLSPPLALPPPPTTGNATVVGPAQTVVPTPTELVSLLNRTALPACVGTRAVQAPWTHFVRGRDAPGWRGVFKSGAYGGSGGVGGGGVNATLGAYCTVTIEAPPGWATRMSFLYLDLAEGETLTVREAEGGRGVLWAYTRPYPNTSINASNVTEPMPHPVVASRVYGGGVEIEISALGPRATAGSGGGYIVSYDYGSRLAAMAGGLGGSPLQYALAVLESQGVDTREMGWADGQAGVLPSGGATLGGVTQGERCFLCCYLGDDYDVTADQVLRDYIAAHAEGAPLLAPWLRRPRHVSSVGAGGPVLSVGFSPTVAVQEVPPIAAYMGYRAAHFLRTQYVSRFPPGTVKAPFGSPLGERVTWVPGAAGEELNVPRPQLGWGLSTLMYQPGGNFSDPSDHGWGAGWGDGDLPGEGTSWRDGDGANAAWFPVWQIASPAGVAADEVRWDGDLDHEDVALFSFVDADRRVVLANDLALSVPCGVLLNNTCGVGCGVVGTGLNLHQCAYAVDKTQCSQPVADGCNNECGLLGQLSCETSLPGPVGAVRIYSARGVLNTSANYQLTVGKMIDPNDGLTRWPDRSKNEVREEVDGGWATASRSSVARQGGTDDGLYISYADPLGDGEFLTVIDGQRHVIKFTREQLNILAAKLPLDIPVPVECAGNPELCRNMDQVEEWQVGLEWLNLSIPTPYWDLLLTDKQADQAETREIVDRNQAVLETLFISDCLGANAGVGVCVGSFRNRMADKLLLMQGRTSEQMPCAEAPATSQCYLTISDLVQLMADLEGRRLEILRTIQDRPRFDMSKILPIPGGGGLEFASPDPTMEHAYNHNANTLRVSTLLELTGSYVRLGASRYLNQSTCSLNMMQVACGFNNSVTGYGTEVDGSGVLESGWLYSVQPNLNTCPGGVRETCFDGGICDITNCSWRLALDDGGGGGGTLSHLFFDGEIDKECPFAFNGGVDTPNRSEWCIQTDRRNPATDLWEPSVVDPESPNTRADHRTITLPDVSGTLLLNTTASGLPNFRGLRKRAANTPFRYTTPSELRLDDGRVLEGGAFSYKRFGAPGGVCGVFPDGVEILCPPLKLQYDAQELAPVRGDAAFVYTAGKILQGTNLTLTPIPAAPTPRVECAALAAAGACAATRSVGGLSLVSKTLDICVDLSDAITTAAPRPCGDLAPCQAQLWCRPIEIWTFPSPYNTPAGFAQLPQVVTPPVRFLLPVTLPTSAPTSCADASQRSQASTSPYAFLQIHHALPLAETYISALAGALDKTQLGTLDTAAPLWRLALQYLDAQGADKLVLGSTSVRINDALLATSPEPLGSSLLEACIVCCQAQATSTAARVLNATLSPPCPWLDVRGLAFGLAVQGAFRLQENRTSFGRPVYRQTPGNVYMYHLNSACTQPGVCGATLAEARALRGPGWVVGPAVGSSHFYFYALDPHQLDPPKLQKPVALGPYWDGFPPQPVNYDTVIGSFTPQWRQAGVLGGGLLSANVTLFCSVVPLWVYASTSVAFDDPTEFRKLSFPDSDGVVISSGNLEDVTELGVLVSPVRGYSGVGAGGAVTATRVKFGVGWQTVTIEEGVNDALDYLWSTGDFAYCTAPATACALPDAVQTGQSLSEIPGCALPLPASAFVGCANLADRIINSDGSGIDAVVVPQAGRGRCVSLYYTHEYYDGEGAAFNETTSFARCNLLGPSAPQTASVIYAGEVPAFWGLTEAECAGLSAEQCAAYKLAGCQTACLRDTACTAVRFDSASRACQVFREGCELLLSREPSSTVRTFLQTGGGWTPQRVPASPYDFLPEIGAGVELGEDPGVRWEVRARYSVCDTDPLGTDPSRCATSSRPLRLTANYSARLRYEICAPVGTSTRVGAHGGDTGVLLDAIPLTNEQIIVRVASGNVTLAGYAAVRVGDDVYDVDPLISAGSSLGIRRRVPFTENSTVHAVGQAIFGVAGGLFNITWGGRVAVPAGVYSLENITGQVNAAVAARTAGREASLALTLREPGAGLCGEVPHGSSYAPGAFGCAPASRYVQLSGRIAATSATGRSNAVHVLNSSTLLPTLGIAAPLWAYSFGPPSSGEASMPPGALQQPAFRGAGFVASGYGRESGYGYAGQGGGWGGGWTNYVPPDKDVHAVLNLTVWCPVGEAGGGYRCADAACACASAPVVTYADVFGATRTQGGGAPADNTLVLPAGADGVLVSTGNLEDVGVDSSAATSVRVDALREHGTAVAAVVRGSLELGGCNDLFGPADCALGGGLGSGVALEGSGGQLSVRTYWDSRLWAAVKGVPSEALTVAASLRDVQQFWRLFPQSTSATVARTYSSTQDAASLAVAGRACVEWCVEEEAAARAAIVDAQSSGLVVIVEERLPALIADPTRYCNGVRCPTSGQEYLVQPTDVGGNTSVAQCAFECGSEPCVCAQTRTCAEIWGAAPRVPQGNAALWLQCVRLLESDAEFTGDPARVAAAQRARADYQVYISDPTLLDAIQGALGAAEQRCVCVEVPGVQEDVAAAVRGHTCLPVVLPAVDEWGRPEVPSRNVSPQVCVSEDPSRLSLAPNGTSSVTVLQFLAVETLPGENRTAVQHLTVPAASGILLTTGNLHDFTAASGAMTSMRVAGGGRFATDLLIGAVGAPAESRGSRVESVPFPCGPEDTRCEAAWPRTTVNANRSRFCEGCPVAGTCDICEEEPDLAITVDSAFVRVEEAGGGGSARVAFAEGAGDWRIAFPVWDDNLCVGHPRAGCVPREGGAGGLGDMAGRIITSGNLEDITHMAPNYVDSDGDADLNGPVELGSAYDCATGLYPRLGWSVHTQAECAEVQGGVDWKGAGVLNVTAPECKAACKEDPACGVAVVNTQLDRRQPDPRCLLFQFRATQCSVRPNPTQDVYLYVREAPSPWVTEQGDAAFFDRLCGDPSVNVTKVPGGEVRLGGFLDGGFLWRPAAPGTWEEHVGYACDVFQGQAPHVLRTIGGAAVKVTLSSSVVGGVIVNGTLVNGTVVGGTRVNGTVVNVTETVVVDPTVEECRVACERDPECRTITLYTANASNVSAGGRVCELSRGVWTRRVLSDWSTLEGACYLVPAPGRTAHTLTRDESIRFSFQRPSGNRTIIAPDASGIIITSGNTYDILGGIGLAGLDPIVFTHAAVVTPFRLRDTGLVEDTVTGGAPVSLISGTQIGMIVTDCLNPRGCTVFVPASVDEATLDAWLQQHIFGPGYGLNTYNGLWPKGVRKDGDGFTYYTTTIDFAEAGSRLGDEECLGDCKGRLPCQRATPACHSECPGYRLPSERFGMTADDLCADILTSGERNARGDRCGCAGGYGYGKYGTGVCVMPDPTHPMEGAFCQNTTMEGEMYPIEGVTCCADPAACGECVAFPPFVAYGKNNRIMFPEASGIVITTGNIDDLEIISVQLEGLELNGPINFGVQNMSALPDSTPTRGAPAGYYYNPDNNRWTTNIDFDPATTKITGGLRMVSGYGDPEQVYSLRRVPGSGQYWPYTHLIQTDPITVFEGNVTDLPEYQQRYCLESTPYPLYKNGSSLLFGEPNTLIDFDRENPLRCLTKREILLPDTGGIVLTTGNLDNVPSTAIPVESLLLAGAESFLEVKGNLTFGRRSNYEDDPANNALGFDEGRRSWLQAHAQIDGALGLTLQSAGDYFPRWVLHTEVDSVVDYGKFGSASPFGSGPRELDGAPTEEIQRFAREGRELPPRPRAWGADFIKITPAVLGGVDTALRAYLRGGAPTLAVSVGDMPSLAGPGDLLRDNFGYFSGRPVLQQRPGVLPSDGASYLPFDPNVTSFTGIPGVEGAEVVDAGYCREAMLAVNVTDPASGDSGASYYAHLAAYLLAEGYVVPTLMQGEPLAPPSFDAAALNGTRFGDAAFCEAFAEGAREKLDGLGTLSQRPSVNVPNATEATLLHSRSESGYTQGDECRPTEWTDITIVADFVLREGSSCLAAGDAPPPTLLDVPAEEECAAACLRLGSECAGYSATRELKHFERGLFGDCTLAIGACVLTPEEAVGVTVLFVQEMTVLSYEEVPRARNCALDYDYTSSTFDALRAETSVSGRGTAGVGGVLGANAEQCFVCCVLPTPGEAAVGEALDGDLTTFVNYHAPDGCFVGLDLGENVKAHLRTVRYAPRAGHGVLLVGGRFQGSNASFGNTSFGAGSNGSRGGGGSASLGGGGDASLGVGGNASLGGGGNDTSFAEGPVEEEMIEFAWEDLFTITTVPRDGVYTEARVEGGGWYRFFRYLGPDGSFCSVAEVEFHAAWLPEPLASVQPGAESHLVNETALQQPGAAAAAELVKCAAHGLLPAWLDNWRQEISLPEANGFALTTGTLSDVHAGAGAMTSVSVAGDFFVGGSTVLGVQGELSALVVNSRLEGGSSVLRFQGSTGLGRCGVMDLGLLAAPGDTLAQLTDMSGTLVVGELPAVMRGVVVLPEGRLDLTWTVSLGNDAKFGGGGDGKADGAELRINSAVAGAFPLSFEGSLPGGARITLASPEPAAPGVLTLPDASGTVLTSGNFPRVLANLTSVRGARMQGGAAFLAGDVRIGDASRPIGLDFNAPILGGAALVFDGASRKDGATLTLSAGDPGGGSKLTLPDTSGTVVTSGNFPSTLERVRAVGAVSVLGVTRMDSDVVRVGVPGGDTRVSIPARISGRFPLTFDGGGVGREGVRTAVMMPASSRDNIITFPDTSGAVVTTTTLPTRLATRSEYRVEARALLLTAYSISMGQPCAEAEGGEGGAEGTFTFTGADQGGFSAKRNNSFLAYAPGGFRFITGRTNGGRDTGAVLKPNTSSWAYLSDRWSKAGLVAANVSETLERLVAHVPPYLWRYDGGGGGDASLHMGALAQDFHRAFGLGGGGEGGDRIGASDMDGVLFAALQGLHARVGGLHARVEGGRERLRALEGRAEEQRARLQAQAVHKARLEQRLERVRAAAAALA